MAMAVAMDAGYKKFGDAEAVLEMVEEIGKGTEFGRVLGSGPTAVGKHFNHARCPWSRARALPRMIREPCWAMASLTPLHPWEPITRRAI